MEKYLWTANIILCKTTTIVYANSNMLQGLINFFRKINIAYKNINQSICVQIAISQIKNST